MPKTLSAWLLTLLMLPALSTGAMAAHFGPHGAETAHHHHVGSDSECRDDHHHGHSHKEQKETAAKPLCAPLEPCHVHHCCAPLPVTPPVKLENRVIQPDTAPPAPAPAFFGASPAPPRDMFLSQMPVFDTPPPRVPAPERLCSFLL